MHIRPASVVEQSAAADLRHSRAQRAEKNKDASFASLLATASSKKTKATKATETTTAPGTDVEKTEDKKGTEDLKLRKNERIKPVEGHAYADILSGPRNGLYMNTSGNKRHGETFQLVMKKGIEYHIYGSGKDRVVVALKPKKDDDAGTEKTSGTDSTQSTDTQKTEDAKASAAVSRI